MRNGRWWVAIAVTLPMLASCAHAGSAQTLSAVSSVPGSTTIATSPTTAASTTDAARQALAAGVADEFLDKVQLPSGAQTDSAAPVAAVSQRDPSSVPADLVADSVRWFTVPGTVESVIGYVRAHPPMPPPQIPGNWSANGPDGLPFTGVSFFGDTSADYAESRVTVAAAADSDLVAVKVEAQVIWVPVRTPAEAVPLTVSRAVAVRVGEGAAAVKVDNADARQLALLLNALVTKSPIPTGCPRTTHTDTVTFAMPSGPMVFEFSCDFGVYVSVNGVNQPDLVSSISLAEKVDSLFSAVGSNAPTGSP